MSEGLQKVYQQEDLSVSEMKDVASLVFSGQLSDAQIGAFLMALKIKGETPSEMAGLAEHLREIARPIIVDRQNTMCNCGTGGDLSNSFNVSTTAAFVLAAAGIKMAKTGNRSVSSKAGSFDTCEALGIDFLLPPEALAEILEEVHLAFIFAPHVHPNMKYIMPARKSLGTPTIMNLIGPLTNPVDLEYQLMGTYRRDLLETTAETLKTLGRRRAIVVNGANFMDEASLAGTNHYALLEKGQITLNHFEPAEVGLPVYDSKAILGGGPTENAAILKQVLKGEQSAYYDTVLLNAGLGLYAAEKVVSIDQGVNLAREIITSGAAFDKLTELLTVQKKMRM